MYRGTDCINLQTIARIFTASKPLSPFLPPLFSKVARLFHFSNEFVPPNSPLKFFSLFCESAIAFDVSHFHLINWMSTLLNRIFHFTFLLRCSNHLLLLRTTKSSKSNVTLTCNGGTFTSSETLLRYTYKAKIEIQTDYSTRKSNAWFSLFSNLANLSYWMVKFCYIEWWNFIILNSEFCYIK